METLYKRIAIEGNIGAGKSTLAKLLAERLNAQFIPEQFEDNPFLENFYADPKHFSFVVELSFLEERFRQMKQAVQKNEIFVADYLWEKSIVFARVNLAGEELRLFERIFKIFSEKQLLPNLVIYLHRPTEKLLHQINRRGREFEKNIQPEYLGKVASGYREMFASENRMPVLWLDNEKGVEALSEEVLKLIRKHFANGLHHNP